MAKQPPSGGCVLKLHVEYNNPLIYLAATFGWLCVETYACHTSLTLRFAATFGWLCVETPNILVLY